MEFEDPAGQQTGQGQLLVSPMLASTSGSGRFQGIDVGVDRLIYVNTWKQGNLRISW